MFYSVITDFFGGYTLTHTGFAWILLLVVKGLISIGVVIVVVTVIVSGVESLVISGVLDLVTCSVIS